MLLGNLGRNYDHDIDVFEDFKNEHAEKGRLLEALENRPDARVADAPSVAGETSQPNRQRPHGSDSISGASEAASAERSSLYSSDSMPVNAETVPPQRTRRSRVWGSTAGVRSFLAGTTRQIGSAVLNAVVEQVRKKAISATVSVLPEALKAQSLCSKG